MNLFVNVLGARYSKSKFNDDYKLASKMATTLAAPIKCSFLPCKQQDKFKYVDYEAASPNASTASTAPAPPAPPMNYIWIKIKTKEMRMQDWIYMY